MLPVKIAGLGWYLPERRVTNAELEERLKIPGGWIERVTGVRERRYVTGESTLSMAVAASNGALMSAGVPLDEVDVIIGASTGPHQLIPCTAALVQRELGAPEGRSACFDVNATCLSFLFALQTASHLVSAGAYRTALIFSSEVASGSLNPRERESAVLFGDAAAAAVVRRSEPGEESAVWQARFATYGKGADLTEIRGGGTHHHPNAAGTTEQMNQFRMNGPGIFKLGVRVLGPFVDNFLSAMEVDRREFDAVVPHQASRHAIEVLTSRLGFTEEQVVWNLALRGNCIAASIPLALAEAVDSGRIQRGHKLLLIGSGAGLTLGAVALTF